MKDIVSWLQQWFYTEDEVDTKVSNLQGQINNKASISDLNNKADKTNGASQITDTNANSYTNISNSLTNTSSQADINSALNTKIGTLMGVDWLVVVSSLPTASANTMGKLYLVAISGSGDNNFKEYVTVEQSGAYSWEKLGEISGSGLSVSWNDVTDKPLTFPPSSHNHNDIYYTESEIDTALSNKISKSSTSGLVKNDGTIDTTNYISDISGKSDKTATIGTTIILVDKGETNEGCIIFNTIS